MTSGTAITAAKPGLEVDKAHVKQELLRINEDLEHLHIILCGFDHLKAAFDLVTNVAIP